MLHSVASTLQGHIFKIDTAAAHSHASSKSLKNLVLWSHWPYPYTSKKTVITPMFDIIKAAVSQWIQNIIGNTQYLYHNKESMLLTVSKG